MIIDDIYCNKCHFNWHPFYDNIIDCNKWHFNRFLNPCLFDAKKWHFNRFVNAGLSTVPGYSQWSTSYKYQTPNCKTNPLIHSTLYLSLDGKQTLRWARIGWVRQNFTQHVRESWQCCTVWLPPIRWVECVLHLVVLPFLEWLDGGNKSLVLHDFVLHHLNLSTNLRVIIELEYLQPIDVRLRDLVAEDMKRVENTHCLHSLQVIPFLTFDCLFPVIHHRRNNGASTCLYDLRFWKVSIRQ